MAEVLENRKEKLEKLEAIFFRFVSNFDDENHIETPSLPLKWKEGGSRGGFGPRGDENSPMNYGRSFGKSKRKLENLEAILFRFVSKFDDQNHIKTPSLPLKWKKGGSRGGFGPKGDENPRMNYGRSFGKP